MNSATTPAGAAVPGSLIHVLLSTPEQQGTTVGRRRVAGMQELRELVAPLHFFRCCTGGRACHRTEPAAGSPVGATPASASAGSVQVNSSVVFPSCSPSAQTDGEEPRKGDDDDDEDNPYRPPLLLSPASASAVGNTVSVAHEEFVWIDVQRPTRREAKELLSLLPVHALTRRGILAGHATDRLEFFPSHGYTTATLTADEAAPLPSGFGGAEEDGAGAGAHAAAAGGTVIAVSSSSSSSSTSSSSSFSFFSRSSTVPSVCEPGVRSKQELLPPVSIFVIAFDSVVVTISSDRYAGEAAVARCAVQLSASLRASPGLGRQAASFVFSALLSALVAEMQGRLTGLLIEVDQLDELVLQVAPSRGDVKDMLTRMRQLRQRVAAMHVNFLYKERMVKQLLLPLMRHGSSLSSDAHAGVVYQRTLMTTRTAVRKLRKARDTINLSNMSMVSGVAARLSRHCHWMDYLNHVQGQIALVVMPVNVIPGLWAMNVRVPWETTTSFAPFIGITIVTVALLLVGVAVPVLRLFTYHSPGAVAPSLD